LPEPSPPSKVMNRFAGMVPDSTVQGCGKTGVGVGSGGGGGEGD